MELFVIIFLLCAGLVTGFLSGLLGVGGGFICVPAVFFMLQECGVPQDTALLAAFGTSLACVFPTVLAGSLSHLRQGNVSMKNAVIIGITGAAMSFAGVFCAEHIPVRVLEILFGCLLVLAAVKMISKSKAHAGENTEMKPVPCIFAGSAAGFLSGMLGVGGSALIVPVLSILGKFSMRRAIGTSSFAIAFITLGGVCAYSISGAGIGVDLSVYGIFSVGFIALPMWLAFIISSIPSAVFSSRVLHGKIPERALRRIFAFLMVMIALDMFGVFAFIKAMI
ncbi:MAG TPA: sulfite exporter TauE/SafE family protein [Methanocorpusculum sp.]|nr:sulfite exporter TauE/SafE family protein [Methanocorpusculum sp.]